MFAMLLLLVTSAQADSHVYLSVAAQKEIAVFQSSPDDGELQLVETVACRAEPGALAVSNDGRMLVAALRSSGELSAFRRDPATGRLTHINTVAAGEDPGHISLDSTGRYLFTAYYVAAKVTVHALDEEEGLSEKPLQSLPTADKAHAILLAPGGKHAFVPHTGSDVIFQFRWDAGEHRLLPSDPPRLTTSPGTGPRHIVFHPKLPIAYVSNEQGNSVTAYQYQSEAGILAPAQTLSTLPSGFDQPSATAEIRIHPQGTLLFCANRGHESLARYSVDVAGKLTFLGATPTERTPRSFDIDPSGKFLYAGGENSGRLACYRVDLERGELKHLRTREIGPKLWWVLCVPAAH